MTTEEITIENNREIALMLGWEPYTGTISSFLNSFKTTGHTSIFNRVEMELKFHTDWNWLMYAVEFIKELKETVGHTKDVTFMVTKVSITNYAVTIDYENGDTYNSISVGHTDNGKYFKHLGDKNNIQEALFSAVTKFAYYYNIIK